MAVKNLYGDWESLPSSSISFIENVMAGDQYEIIYDQIRQDEKDNQDVLLQFNSKYPGVLKEDNVEDIADNLRNKGEPESILALLREKNPGADKIMMLCAALEVTPELLLSGKGREIG